MIVVSSLCLRNLIVAKPPALCHFLLSGRFYVQRNWDEGCNAALVQQREETQGIFHRKGDKQKQLKGYMIAGKPPPKEGKQPSKLSSCKERNKRRRKDKRTIPGGTKLEEFFLEPTRPQYSRRRRYLTATGSGMQPRWLLVTQPYPLPHNTMHHPNARKRNQ